MNKIKAALSSYGIPRVEEIYYNLSYDELFEHETDPSLEGYRSWLCDRYRCSGRRHRDLYRAIAERQTHC